MARYLAASLPGARMTLPGAHWRSPGSALAGPYADLVKLLDELIGRADKLEDDATVGADARALRGYMRGGRTRLANLVLVAVRVEEVALVALDPDPNPCDRRGHL